MNWLKQTTEYSISDRRRFKFCPGDPFNVKTVTLIAKNGDIEHEIIEHHSESALKEWIDKWSPSQDHPTFSLIIHERYNNKTDSLPYSEGTFETLSTKLYQHRSLASWNMQRASAAILNFKRINWTLDGSEEQAIVYNCKSDTETLKSDDILLSTTYFKDRPWIFSAIYGYPSDESDYLVDNIKKFKELAFHPLTMPMLFVEYERGRYLEEIETIAARLEFMIENLEYTLLYKQSRFVNRADKKMDDMYAKQKEWHRAKDWDKSSRLRYGMESFRKVLNSLEQQFETFKVLKLVPHLRDTDERIFDSISSEHVRCRLRELDAEVGDTIRKCERLLASMTLATQFEWNHRTRLDAKANMIIAHASYQDSTQMRMISWIGMIFLPGTFFATFFSMSFFQWTPEDSSQMVSPWVFVYVGLTAIITGGIGLIWWWKAKKQPDLEQFILDLEKGLE